MSPLRGLGQTTVEPELQGRTPRRVRYATTTQAARLFVWLLLLGTLGLITHFGNNDLTQLRALQAHGETATGHVTGLHVTHGKSNTYYLDYMFLTGQGVISDSERVSYSEYSDTREGDPLTVTYLPDASDAHRVGIIDDRYIHHSINMWLGGAAFAAFILGLIVFFMEKNYRNHRALLENGVAVTGHITDRQIVQGGKSTYYYVHYEFDGPGGMVAGKVSVTRKVYDQTFPGTAATILYNPTRPNNSRPYYVLTDVLLA